MKKFFYSFFFLLLLLFATYLFLTPKQKEKASNFQSTVNVYTWVDFIPLELQKKFEQETGYKLNIDYIDSDEMLEAKLLTGKSEYDVVYPSTPYIFRHMNLGVYASLDLSLITNYQNVDSVFMNHFTSQKGVFFIPYLWGSSGLCYNVNVFNKVFPGVDVDSWGYVFNPDKLKLISKFGVASNVSPNELFSSIGFWRGYTPSTHPSNESFIQDSYSLAKKARPFWRVFLSSDASIQALGSGEVALAFMWNGDAVEAVNLARSKGKVLRYMVPKEGGLLWIDGLAIPKTSKNKIGAHAFINFLLEPKNMAVVTNAVRFANTASGSKPYINPKIVNNRVLYPVGDEYDRLHLDKRSSPKLERSINRHFFKILVAY